MTEERVPRISSVALANLIKNHRAKNEWNSAIEFYLRGYEDLVERCAKLERELAGYRPMRGNFTPAFPFTHWSKDPLIPYFGCDCGSCENARQPLTPRAEPYATDPAYLKDAEGRN